MLRAAAASAVVNEARSSRVALRMDGSLPIVEQRSDPLLDSGFRLDSGSGGASRSRSNVESVQLTDPVGASTGGLLPSSTSAT